MLRRKFLSGGFLGLVAAPFVQAKDDKPQGTFDVITDIEMIDDGNGSVMLKKHVATVTLPPGATFRNEFIDIKEQ